MVDIYTLMKLGIYVESIHPTHQSPEITEIKFLKPITILFNIRKDEIYYMMNESQAKMSTP